MPRVYSKSRKGKVNSSNNSNYSIANIANQTLYYLNIGMWWLLCCEKEYLLDSGKIT